MTDVTVIGLGNMGAALARTLLASGRSVTVWNRSPGRMAPLLAAGAQRAASPRDALEASRVTLVCIMTHADTRALLAAADADLAGRTLVELSTGGADAAEALAAAVRDDFPRMLRGLMQEGVDAGLAKKNVTVLTRLFAASQGAPRETR